MISKVNTAIDQLDADQLVITSTNNPAEVLKTIGLIAPVLIMFLQAWKALPGIRRTSRNAKIDLAIIALKASSIFYSNI